MEKGQVSTTTGGRINGLDLFSGIGGITIALSEWVRPIAYCEIEKYAQAQLLSRMQDGLLPRAPIWTDITSLRGKDIPEKVDIIYGGFPCQDISVAGHGRGLEGERSGLFFEIVRLAQEIKPTFIFLENVPAIRTRGAARVSQELAQVGYDCRWDTVSAQEIGAPHKRERWFMLAYSESGVRKLRRAGRDKDKNSQRVGLHADRLRKDVPNPDKFNCWDQWKNEMSKDRQMDKWQAEFDHNSNTGVGWSAEPNVGRVANGIPQRVDRIKALGNAVVPIQAKTAFKRLMGLDSLNLR